ncbi:MAG: nucleotidyltransferase family protein [Alphaproteobacteria bacterium]
MAGGELSSDTDILALVAADAWMMAALGAVAGLGLPDAWIGAGFLRGAVWDRLHGYASRTPLDDIDVIYFDPEAPDPAAEAALERRLGERLPGLPWSVKNQARMHLRNGDAPYRSSADALAHWLETPTAVALRLDEAGGPELLAPFGTRDLLGLVVRPTPHARKHEHRLAAYRARLEVKNWPAKWPKLKVVWE